MGKNTRETAGLIITKQDPPQTYHSKKQTLESEQTNWQNKENCRLIRKENTVEPKPVVNRPIACC